MRESKAKGTNKTKKKYADRAIPFICFNRNYWPPQKINREIVSKAETPFKNNDNRYLKWSSFQLE